MAEITDRQILKQLQNKLYNLLEEDKKAEIDKEKRIVLIKKAKLAIDLFSESENSVIDNGIEHVDISENNIEKLNGYDYSQGKTWKDKIKNYMTYTSKAVTISELVNEFKKHESDYTKERISGAMNNAIQAMLKKGVLQVYAPPIKMKGYYYANPLWFDGEALKEEHIPDFKKKLLW